MDKDAAKAGRFFPLRIFLKF